MELAIGIAIGAAFSKFWIAAYRYCVTAIQNFKNKE